MLKILVSDKYYLELPDSTSVPMYLKNPFCNDGAGSFSFETQAEWTANNRRALNYADNLNNASNTTEKYSAVFMFDSFFSKGYINITNSTKETFTFYYTGGRGSFNTVAQNMYLTDLAHKELINPDNPDQATTALSQAVIDYGSRNFATGPVYMPNYKELEVLGNSWKMLNGWLVHDQSVTGNHSLYFMLHFVITKMFSELGYSVRRNIFYKDTELRKLHIFNFNMYQRDADYDNKKVARFSHDLPRITLRDFVDALENKFCCTFFVYDNTNEVYIYKNEDIIFSTKTHDYTVKTEKGHEIDHETFSGYKLTETIDSGDSFLSDAVQQLIDFEVEDSVESFVYLPVAGETYLSLIYYVTDQDTYYQCQYEAPESEEEEEGTYSWKVYSFNLMDKTEGTADKIWQTTASTLAMHKDESGALQYDFFVPRADNERSMFEKAKQNSLRLLFYRGKFPAKVVQTLPSATYTDNNVYYYKYETKELYRNVEHAWVLLGVYEPNELDQGYYPLFSSDVFYNGYLTQYHKISNANYALHWNGDCGLYEKLWKNYIHWYLNFRKPVTRQINYDKKDLANIRWHEKIRIKNQNYIRAEIPITFKLREMIIGETELVRVY